MNREAMQRLGAILRDARVAVGASLRDIARRSAISSEGLGEIERGTATHGAEVYARILWAIAETKAPRGAGGTNE